jgi:hypothetical protein
VNCARIRVVRRRDPAFTTYFPGQTANLIKGYALMAGIAGCVLAAVLVAMVVKPKRLLRETDQGPIDHVSLLRELALNKDEERLALQTASPKLIREMQQLQIYDLFADCRSTTTIDDAGVLSGLLWCLGRGSAGDRSLYHHRTRPRHL